MDAERFGYEWTKYSVVSPHHKEQFQRWLPFFAPKDWIGKRFLDVGCGMGRNSVWPAAFGAASGVAVDIGDQSLSAARKNLAHYPVTVEKCSAYDLHWTNEFDIVFSIGVIHHLEFPDKALRSMKRATRPGGCVAIWVYGRENNGWLLWALDPTRKLVFSWMPVSLLYFVSLIPAVMLWLLLRLGLNKNEYFRLLRTLPFQDLRVIVFDQLLPRIANYWTRAQVEALMHEAGFERVQLAWVNKMSWAALGWRSQ